MLAVVGGFISAVVVAQPALAYPSKPPTDFSFYINSTSTSAAYTLGCNQGNFDTANGKKNSTTVLDFGAQNSALTGAYYPGTSTFIPKANIEAVAEEFAHGYWACTGSNVTSINYLSIGTNNSGANVSYAAGQAWAAIINDVKTYVNAHYGQVYVWAANDMEPSWHNYSDTLAWAQGYDDNTTQLYVNFGSADGCSTSSYANNSCNNGWNTYDVWYLSWGFPSAWATPEIYVSAQSSQWFRIAQYGYYYQSAVPIYRAPLDENDLDGGTYTSQQAWDALVSKLYSDSNTSIAPYGSIQIHQE